MSELAALQAEFLDMLGAGFRGFGLPAGLPATLAEAVAATPRHRFVHRFRIDDGPLSDSDADPDANLQLIYSDAVMRHVDAAGTKLPSSNSQPSYILYLMHLLALEPGQAVLEIGSGSGWLAAVMARLVGPAGRVVGIELIAELAAQSRTDLAALGIDTVEIVTGDGDLGHAASAPFDRAMVTAATWALPLALFEQVAEGGLVLAPIELRSADGCVVTLLRRRGDVFVAELAVPGWFVPLLGAGQVRTRPMIDEPPGVVVARVALPLGMSAARAASPVAAHFSAFLGRTEPGYVIGRSPVADTQPSAPPPPFGLQLGGSTALWSGGDIVAYGDLAAARALARAYLRWTSLGLPGIGAFQLEVHRADAAPPGSDRVWIEKRPPIALVWRLPPEIDGWRSLT